MASEASKRRRATARHEAHLTGRTWESDRARKRRLRAERLSLAARPDWTSAHGGVLLDNAAAFAKRDDRSRGIRGRVSRANGDGDKPTRRERETPVVAFNESARGLLGY